MAVELDPVVDVERRRELGAFLRSRRERLSPEAVELPPGPRRRTPGLRREEVAQLARIGVTWYTWLEQGRAANASPLVLAAVARALRLDASERAHVFALAGLVDPELPELPGRISPSLRRTLDALDPLPAYVVSARSDVLAYNRTVAALMGDFDALPAERRNTLWLLFAEPRWGELVLDWESEAPRVLAQFRAAMARHLGDPAWQALVEDLEQRSARFRRLWSRHDVAGPTGRVKRFHHPAVGVLRLESTSLWLTDVPDARLVVYTPVDDATTAVLPSLSRAAPRTWS